MKGRTLLPRHNLKVVQNLSFWTCIMSFISDNKGFHITSPCILLAKHYLVKAQLRTVTDTLLMVAAFSSKLNYFLVLCTALPAGI